MDGRRVFPALTDTVRGFRGVPAGVVRPPEGSASLGYMIPAAFAATCFA